MNPKTILLLLPLFASSCASRQTLETTTPNPYYGDYASKNTVELVRDAPVVKEYTIRPYVSRTNPDVRMPGGSMFVVTRPGRWNTEPNTRNGIVVEPQYTSTRENVVARSSVQQARAAEVKAERARKLALDGALEGRASQRRLEDRIDALELQLQQKAK